MDASIRFKEWIVRAEFSKDAESLKLEKFTCPRKVGKKIPPKNLDDMTIGQMVQMSNCMNGRDMFYIVCRVLLEMDKREVNECWAIDIVRFVGWVLGRVKVINDLFDSVKSKPTPEEERAGIGRLKFGIFGMVDWYATRMGITDHEEVMGVTWVRVYKCMEMDTKRMEFERRLAKIYQNEHRK